MEFTQTALLMLLLFWTLQVAGSWIQWRHFNDAMRETSRRWSDGFLGVGRSKGRLSAGAVALLSVDQDLRVRQLQLMKGFSVFARFKPSLVEPDLPLSELADRVAPDSSNTAESKAIRSAISQIEEVHRKQR